MLSSIFFDLRPVYGNFSLFESLQRNTLSLTKHNEFFIAHMVSNALTHKPPLGFFKNFVLVHDAEHKMMECLGRILWEAQRNQSLPDDNAYLECLKRAC